MRLKERSCWDVNIRMDDAEKLSVEAIGQFDGADRALHGQWAGRGDGLPAAALPATLHGAPRSSCWPAWTKCTRRSAARRILESEHEYNNKPEYARLLFDRAYQGMETPIWLTAEPT
jgi:hypothetical protein